MALLVVGTKDVTKALALQQVAMDLARLRGTDLAETSTLISKVYQGNLTSLKRFGISLKDVSNSTEALAAIQKLAAGQAEAYADTLVGKTEAMGIALEDFNESIGGLASGPLTSAIDFANIWATNLRMLTGDLDINTLAIEDRIALMRQQAGEHPAAIQQAEREIAVLVEQAATQERLNRQMERGKDRSDALTGATKDVRVEFHRAYRAADDLADALDDVKESANDAADALAEAVYGPEILRANLAETKIEIAETTARLKELAKKKDLTRDDRQEIAQLQGKLGELRSDVLTTTTRLALLGDKPSSGALAAYLDRMYAKTDKWDDETIRLINHLRYLAGLTGANGSTGPINVTGGPTPKAHGGPVLPGRTYTVGEQGPETLVMGGRGGMVIPNGGAQAGGGGGGAPVVLQVNMDGQRIADIVDRRLYYAVAQAARTRQAV
jgi:hypothetical protein